MMGRPSRSTLFPTRRSSDLETGAGPAILVVQPDLVGAADRHADRKSTRLNSSHGYISYAVFCLKKKIKHSCLITRIATPLHCIRPVLPHNSLIISLPRSHFD